MGKQAKKKSGGNIFFTIIIIAAMAFAGYNIDRDLLNRLFGAKCDRGRTAKKLRDAVTHNLEQKAIDEIVSRQSELFADMDEFLEIIRAA